MKEKISGIISVLGSGILVISMIHWIGSKYLKLKGSELLTTLNYPRSLQDVLDDFDRFYSDSFEGLIIILVLILLIYYVCLMKFGIKRNELSQIQHINRVQSLKIEQIMLKRRLETHTKI